MATLRELKRIAPKALGGDADSARNVEELLDAAIAFANKDLRFESFSLDDKPPAREATARMEKALARYGVSFPEQQDAKRIPKESSRRVSRRTLQKSVDFLVDYLHDEVVSIFESATKGKQTLYSSLMRLDFDGLIPVSARPHWEIEKGGRIRIDWRIAGDERNPIHLVRFALAALASRTEGDALPIGRCTLDSCGKFFIIRKQPGEPGRLRTKYCSTDHMAAAHQAGSHERVRLSRERKRLAKLQKHKRRMPK
jgi:hypothetical protein